MKSVQQIAEQQLHSGETLIWYAQPEPRTVARAWMMLGLLGIPFTAFAVFWEYTAFQSGAPLFFLLWGVPFIAVGLGMLLSPLWHRIVAKGMVYAITNERLLVIVTWPWRKIRSFYAADINALERKWEKADGVGTVIFAERESRGRRKDSRPPWGFYGVGEAARVEGVIRKLKMGEALDDRDIPARLMSSQGPEHTMSNGPKAVERTRR